MYQLLVIDVFSRLKLTTGRTHMRSSAQDMGMQQWILRMILNQSGQRRLMTLAAIVGRGVELLR